MGVECDDYVLIMDGIVKSFPGVKALDGMSIKVRPGTVHALVGENGAGKSTLMKVLSGVHPHGTYSGQVFFAGEECRFSDIKASERAGIVIIHQELAQIPELSVAENIFLGNEVVQRGLIDWDEARRRTLELLRRVGLPRIDPRAPIKNLGVGQQQLVEIAKALSKDVRVLILDEPTSALNEEDSDHLLELMRELKGHGITCIMISHKLNEIARIADAVTVIRDGRTVDHLVVDDGEIDEDHIIRAMVGRSIENRYPDHTPTIGEIIFEVRDWRVEHPSVPGWLVCKDSSFFVRKGEVVGFAGLMGAGRTELARSLFGRSYGVYHGGRMFMHGKEVTAPSVASAIDLGLAYLPEDRKTQGLNLLDTVKKTVVSANLKAILRHRLLDLDEETVVAERFRKALRIKTPTVNVGVQTLSGGNQQKAVLAKWMYPDPDVLILDEPTRGIDVGAKYEIYTLIHELADRGKAVVLISSELPELLGMSDRIYTICEGRVTAVFDREEADQEKLMRMMTTTTAKTAH